MVSASAPTSSEKPRPPDPRGHAAKTRDSADFARIEDIGGERVDERGDHLVRKTAERRKVRLLRTAETTQGRCRRAASIINAPSAHACDARPDQRHAQMLHQER